MESKRPASLSTFILVSLGAHLLFLLAIPHLELPTLASRSNEIEVLLESGQQIADIAPPANPQRPEKAKFLGNYDSTALQEQVAATPPHPEGGEGQRGDIREREAAREKEDRKMVALIAPDEALTRARRPRDIGDGGAGEGLAPMEDFFPDYKVGGHTYLNVQAHPDVGYFVRLKKVFRTTFNPVPALASYFYANQITRGRIEVVVAVTVDWTGELEELFVLRDSGIKGYNDEVLRTIRDSAPFSKPPQKFLTADDKLRMAWAFTVYL